MEPGSKTKMRPRQPSKTARRTFPEASAQVRPSVFALMPFSDPFTSYYQVIYKPALEQAGFQVTRADDLFGPRAVMRDIAKSIAQADIIFCEMSGRNPNVFYELGLAHSIGKPAILVSNCKDDIPFDLRHIRVLLYDTQQAEWASRLRHEITTAAREVISSSPSELQSFVEPLLLGRFLLPHQKIEILKGRSAVVGRLPEIVARAQKGDVIFGSCNNCADYPMSLYDLLVPALERGVKIRFIVRDTPDAEGFIRLVGGVKRLRPRSVQLFTSKDDYLPVFGIADREFLLGVRLPDDFLGIHFIDGRMAHYLKISFDTVVARSQLLRLPSRTEEQPKKRGDTR